MSIFTQSIENYGIDPKKLLVVLCGRCDTCYFVMNHDHVRPPTSKCTQYSNLECKNGKFMCIHCDWEKKCKYCFKTV